jgi:hypothetical protein
MLHQLREQGVQCAREMQLIRALNREKDIIRRDKRETSSEHQDERLIDTTKTKHTDIREHVRIK